MKNVLKLNKEIRKHLDESATDLSNVMQLPKLSVKNHIFWTNIFNISRRFKRVDKLILVSKKNDKKALQQACTILNGDWEPKFNGKNVLQALEQYRMAYTKFNMLFELHKTIGKNDKYVISQMAKYKWN